MAQTFDRGVRLRSHAEFRAVSDHGRRVAARYVTLVARPNALGRDRFGIIASRRLGGAVVRNRAKRRLREVFRTQNGDGEIVRPARALDVVAIARRELLDAPLSAIATDFQAALRRLRGAG